MECLGIGRRNDAIALTPDDVGRGVHPVQPALEPRIEEARLPSEARAGDAVEDGEILIFIGGSAGSRFLAELGIGIGEARLLLRIDDEDIGLAHTLDMDAGSRDQRQTAQTLRRAHRHFERNPPAQRLPEDVNAGEAERLDGIEIAIGEIGNIINPGRRLRAAEAGMIGHDHIETLRQGIEKGRPFRKPVGAVQVDQRHALPATRQAELAAIKLDRLPGKPHDQSAVPVRRRER